MQIFASALLSTLCVCAFPHACEAAESSSLSSSASTSYAKFVAGATAQNGLFTIWRDGNQVDLELRPDQFDRDYVELGVPVNGVGAGIYSGTTGLQRVRIIRFERQDDRVAILFPSTRFLAKSGSPESHAVDNATAPSVLGVAKIIAENAATGAVVFDATSFLSDVIGLADDLSDLGSGRTDPAAAYRLDPARTYFGQTKAFPKNAIINVFQTFVSQKGRNAALATAPDTRSLRIQVQYTIAQVPSDGYMPRLYDDRVGYAVNAHMDFGGDERLDKSINYIVRWNLQKADPNKALSPAKQPVVYYLSNSIPFEYRDPIRRALLEWNEAFRRIGISDAIEVRDQPADPAFDPDDLRYNVVRWVTQTQGGFAEAQRLYNPYTGEMIKSGVVIDSDLMRHGRFWYPTIVAPTTGDVGSEETSNFAFGLLAVENGSGSYDVPETYADQYLESQVLHEAGHDFGLEHNFMASQAYTAKQLQSKAFTSVNGLSSSVMDYLPVNIWPKGTQQGDYFQTVLGPYDYYAIRWGYAPVSGARTPQDELPTLDRWASVWSEPRYSYLSDEDTQWDDGNAVDPRNQKWDLSNDNIGWCQTRMALARSLLSGMTARFPADQAPFDDLRSAFAYTMFQYSTCVQIVSNYLGGEYLSRARRGDAAAQLPLSPIPLATQERAFALLRNDLFNAESWDFSSSLLRQMVTQYRNDDWEGNHRARHDIAVEDVLGGYQQGVIDRLFLPITLARLDDMHLKYGSGRTMGLVDLFAWMQDAVYGDVSSTKAIPLVRRNLQRNYAAALSRLATEPSAGTPADARALARYELQMLHDSIKSALRHGVPDLLTRVHLLTLDFDVERALASK